MPNFLNADLVRCSSFAGSVIAVLFFTPGFGYKTATTMMHRETIAAPPRRILYLFPQGDGDGIPKGNEREVADQMLTRVSDKLATKAMYKQTLDPAECPTPLVCEVVQVHAEQRDNKIFVKLKFNPLRGVQHQLVVTEDEPCLLQPGTDVHDCLESGLDLLKVELITHNRKYHDRDFHGGDQ